MGSSKRKMMKYGKSLNQERKCYEHTRERGVSCWLVLLVFSASTFSSPVSNGGPYSNGSVQHDVMCIQNSNTFNWSPTTTRSKITPIQVSKCF